MLRDTDRIFTNIYGHQDPFFEGAKSRGDWDGTKNIEMGRDAIIEVVEDLVLGDVEALDLVQDLNGLYA